MFCLRQSHVAEAGLELLILLPLPPKLGLSDHYAWHFRQGFSFKSSFILAELGDSTQGFMHATTRNPLSGASFPFFTMLSLYLTQLIPSKWRSSFIHPILFEDSGDYEGDTRCSLFLSPGTSSSLVLVTSFCSSRNRTRDLKGTQAVTSPSRVSASVPGPQSLGTQGQKNQLIPSHPTNGSGNK